MTYLNFLLRITDIITSRLPKTAATIIDIINDALNMKNKYWNHVFSGAGFSVVDPPVRPPAFAASLAAAVALEAKSSVVVDVDVAVDDNCNGGSGGGGENDDDIVALVALPIIGSDAWWGCCRCDRYLGICVCIFNCVFECMCVCAN